MRQIGPRKALTIPPIPMRIISRLSGKQQGELSDWQSEAAWYGERTTRNSDFQVVFSL
jgi:hypothetical protein